MYFRYRCTCYSIAYVACSSYVRYIAQNVSISISITFENQFPKVHCKENPIYVFFEKKLRRLVPSSYIHVSVRDLCIPTIGLPILLQENRWTARGNTYKSFTDT